MYYCTTVKFIVQQQWVHSNWVEKSLYTKAWSKSLNIGKTYIKTLSSVYLKYHPVYNWQYTTEIRLNTANVSLSS